MNKDTGKTTEQQAANGAARQPSRKITARNILKRDGANMDLPIGGTVLVEPAGVGRRFKTNFIGMERAKYVLLRLPLQPELREHLYLDKPVIVRAQTASGQLGGFESRVQGMSFSPQPLLFLDFPTVFELLNLRKHDRIDCFIPAALYFAQARIPMVITNLSRGGCRFILETEHNGAAEAILPGAEVRVEFTLLGFKEDILLAGAVRANAPLKDDKRAFGVEFAESSGGVEDVLERYVSRVLEFVG